MIKCDEMLKKIIQSIITKSFWFNISLESNLQDTYMYTFCFMVNIAICRKADTLFIASDPKERT
mgnify:CR=1 FL=1